MKKTLLFIIALSLLLTVSALFSACSPETTPCAEHNDENNDGVCDVCTETVGAKCTAHKDENADKLCDACSTEFFPRCSKHTDANSNAKCDVCGKAMLMDITVSLRDQEGTLIPGVTVIFTDEEFEEYVFITDEDGTATVELYAGRYRVTYDTTDGVYFPEGYLPIPSNVNVTSDNRNVTVEITKTVPNGEPSRPFPLSSETTEIEIPAATTYYYIIYHSSGRKVSFEGDSYKIVYGDKTYTSVGEKIGFTLAETASNENSLFSIENTSDTDITVSFSLYSDPGTYGNPFIIESAGSIENNSLAADSSVYYKWVADKDGTVVFSTSQILIFKTDSLSTSYVLVKTSGSADSVEGVYELSAEGVEYTIVIDSETLTVTDSTAGDNNVSGTYSYTVGANNALVIKNSNDVTVPITLYCCAGRTISITNRTDSLQATISNGSNQATLNVSKGDEILVSVTSIFEIDFYFVIKYA